jgi:methanogenic corrinoid protein MtbC1
MLNRLADYFGVSMDFLLGRREQEYGYEGNVAAEVPDEQTERSLRGRRFLELLLDGREDEAAEGVLAEARSGRSAGEVYEDILQSALIRVGVLWEQGRLETSQEHFVSGAIERLMGRLRPVFEGRPSNGLTVVGVSAGAETHVVGVRMVLDLLELDGWRGYYLGASLPAADVISALEDRSAALLALSVTLPAHVASAENLITAVRERKELRSLRVLVGGQAFNRDHEALSRISPDGYARSASEAVTISRRLFGP